MNGQDPPASGPPSRRMVLLTAGGLATAGGGFAAGFGLSRAAEPGAGQTSATLLQDLAVPPPGEDLMAGHGLLIRVLLIYRQMTAGQAAGEPVQRGSSARFRAHHSRLHRGIPRGTGGGLRVPAAAAAGRLETRSARCWCSTRAAAS